MTTLPVIPTTGTQTPTTIPTTPPADSPLNGWAGRLVRLVTLDPEKDAELWVKWMQDSEYQQLLDWGPAMLHAPKTVREWIEKGAEGNYEFSIHTLEDDRIIGFIGLGGLNWTAGDAWVGIGIGDRDYQGKGYGTDAMRILLRFAFQELNMKRVSLSVFEYNARAVRSYEKAGFQVEGRQRQFLNRYDRRWDMIYMGILRSEWEENQKEHE